MPREPRIEYADALYHVLNRGNYRQDLFVVQGAGASFEQTLYEACERFGWQVHAFVLMSNHYHLCLETRDANLGLGMQWLQSTFANRFNRFVHERGHVFQGRYKALLIERGDSLLRVVNYIHLNPVRASIEKVETLERYTMSSFPRFFSHKRPACLVNTDWLSLAGNLKPTKAGMRCYQKYLALSKEGDRQRCESLYRELCRGWYVGTREGKQALLKDMDKGLLNPAVLGRVMGEDRAMLLLEEGLRRLGKGLGDLASDLRLSPWKVVLAGWIKQQSSVGNRWFSEVMYMGSIYGISKAIAEEMRKKKQRGLWQRLMIAKS